MKSFVKDPDAILDYTFDWGPWLGVDTISTSTWVAESGITIVPASEAIVGNLTRLYLSGGSVNMGYEITNRITTVDSRTEERTILIRVRER